SNSVSENALCGTALEYGGGSNVVFSSNTFSNNGVHQNALWSDGLTIGLLSNSNVTNNFFQDNTDVDLIFGSCQNCIIQNNQVRHSGAVTQGSFAALMIQAWPPNIGNYSGSDISKNQISCNSACGFGLLIGGDPWYPVNIVGGFYHDNVIIGAQQGFTISH